MLSGLVRFVSMTAAPGRGLWRNRFVPSTPIVLPTMDSDLREGTKPRRIVVRRRAGLAMALPSLASDQAGLPASGA